MSERLKSLTRNQKKLSAFLAYVSYCLILSWNSFHKNDNTNWFYGNIHAQNNYLRKCIVKCVVNKKERKKSRNTWKKTPICFWNPVDQSLLVASSLLHNQHHYQVPGPAFLLAASSLVLSATSKQLLY